MKIRKLHVRKKYRYNVNRKTLNRKQTSTGQITDPLLKKLWKDGDQPAKNFKHMGLSNDPNKAIPLPSYKQDCLKVAKIMNGRIDEEGVKNGPARKKKTGKVAKKLEEMVNQPKDSLFRLPKGVVTHLSYFLDKYKLNYKDMVMDKRNHDQWTWKQFRMKIRNFMSIPEQFNIYLEKNGMSPGNQILWKEYDSDSEW